MKLPDPSEFCAQLAGATFVAVRRRAKYLFLDLDSGRVWALQLALYGQFLLREAPTATKSGVAVSTDALDPDTLLVVELAGGAALHALDRSRYTRLYLGLPGEIANALRLDALGPEPVDPAFTADVLAAVLAGRRGRLKALLLHQHAVAGLGNIYVDEALWRARLHPGRAAGSLTPDEVRALHAAIQSVVREAIANRGTTFHTYRDLLGAKGMHQDHLAVFHRQGAPCPRCGTPVERITLASRDTHLCPTCQASGGAQERPLEGAPNKRRTARGG